MNEKTIGRRALLKGALAGITAIGVVGVATRASAAAVPLDVNDAQAKSLGFVLDAAKVDAKANPNFKPDQKCANCAQYKGAATDATGRAEISSTVIVGYGNGALTVPVLNSFGGWRTGHGGSATMHR